MQRVAIDDAAHYVWGNVCDGWHFVNTPNLSVIVERIPPGAGERMHFHTNATQLFYVLEGEATMNVDGGPVTLGPGEGIRIDPGERHRLENHGLADLRFLVVSQPHSHGDRRNVE